MHGILGNAGNTTCCCLTVYTILQTSQPDVPIRITPNNSSHYGTSLPRLALHCCKRSHIRCPYGVDYRICRHPPARDGAHDPAPHRRRPTERIHDVQHPPHAPSGSPPRDSTRSTRRASPIRTATASATSQASSPDSTTSETSAATRCGSTPASTPRSRTPDTTYATISRSPRAMVPNDDLVALFDEAHRRGHARVARPGPRPYQRGASVVPHQQSSGIQPVLGSIYLDRFMDLRSDGLPFIGGETPRNGTYVLNFFKCQPALNYGFAHPERPWQMGTDSPAATGQRQAMIDIMRFWLSQGCDGFRVDMANSLVKKRRHRQTATIAAWREMLGTGQERVPRGRVRLRMGRAGAGACRPDSTWTSTWTGAGTATGITCSAATPQTRWTGAGPQLTFSAHGGGSIHGFLDQYLPQYRGDQGRRLLLPDHLQPRHSPTGAAAHPRTNSPSPTA